MGASVLALVAVLVLGGPAPALLANSSHASAPTPLDAATTSPSSPKSGHVYGEVTLGAGTDELTGAYVPSLHELYVPDASGGLTVINATTNQRIAVNTNVSAPGGVVYDPALNRLYVSDVSSGTVEIINPSQPRNVSFFATLPPAGGIIAYDPVSGLLWVAEVVGPIGYLWTVDPLTGIYQLVTSISGGTFTDMAYDNSTDFMFITYTTASGDYLLAYDDVSGVLVSDVVTSNPIYVAIDPAADLLVTDNGTGLTYFDPASQDDSGIGAPVATLALPSASSNLAALVYDPLTQAIVVAQDEGTSNGQVLFASATGPAPLLVSSILVGPKPDGITFDPDNDNLYVAGSASLTILGATSFSIQAESAVPTFERVCCEQAIVYVPTTKTLWVMSADPSASPVGIYAAGGNHHLVHAVHAGQYGEAMLYDPLTNSVLVWNYGNKTISVINVTTYSMAFYSVPGQGYSMAFDPVHDTIGLSDYNQGNFTVLSAENYTVLANFAVGAEPTGVAYDPPLSAFVVANQAANNVSVVQGTTHLYDRPVSYFCSCRMSGIAYDPASGDLVIQWANAFGVAIVNGHTLSSVRWLDTASFYGNAQQWTTMAYDPADHNMFVFAYNPDEPLINNTDPMLVVNARGQSLALSTQGATTNWPQSAVFDPITNQLAVPSYTEMSFYDS